MDEAHEPPVVGACSGGGSPPSFQAGREDGGMTNSCSIEEPSGGDEEVVTDAPLSSEVVRLLDEELAELEQLMKLQARKVDALERLRRQWLSGERKLPDVLPPPIDSPRGAVVGNEGGDSTSPASDAYHKSGQEQQWDVPPPPWQLPTGFSEHYMTPLARFPSSSPVVAAEMLSFRLKGGKSRPISVGGVRSGFLNVFAYLHADGMVHLRDTDGEEILAFDAGHSRTEGSSSRTTAVFSSSGVDGGSPKEVVIGLAADATESGPVLVTAGADGTARVHALAVYYRDRQVAGKGTGGGRSRSDSSSVKRKTAPVGDSTGRSTGTSTSTSSTKDEASPRNRGSSTGKMDDGGDSSGGADRSHGSPPATAIGVGVAVEFNTCLGSACRETGVSSPLRNTETTGESFIVDSTIVSEKGTTRSAGESLRPLGETATITSMDAFYHRSLGTTVVIAGYSSGGVRFFHAGNGTELGSADTGSSAVLAVKRGGQSIAFSDGDDVHFVSAAKFTRTPDRVCRGGRRFGSNGERAVVTALAFDAVSTGLLYVGFGTGAVMAYDSRLQEKNSSNKCLPSHRLPPPPPPPPLQQRAPSSHADAPATASVPLVGGGGGLPEGRCDSISTVRGYTIVSHGPLLSVYNTTDQAGQLLFTRHAHATQQASEYCGGLEFSVAGSEGVDEGSVGANAHAAEAGAERRADSGRTWAVMSSLASREVLVAEASRCSAEVVVYRAVLPYERTEPDISWIRVPVLLLGLFVVAITQVYSRRTATDSVGRTSVRKGRGTAGRGWAALSDEDDDDRDADISIDSLARLRGDLGGRKPGGRCWDHRGGAREASSSSSSRLPAPARGLGDPYRWEEGSD